jgi:hypothetical protein
MQGVRKQFQYRVIMRLLQKSNFAANRSGILPDKSFIFKMLRGRMPRLFSDFGNFCKSLIMNGFIKLLIRSLFLTAILMFGGILPSYAADLQRFSNAQLINNPANDGDSFLVGADGKLFHVRLYFVDCPETSISFMSDAQRVREQTRYFGLSDAARTIHFGNEAKTFVERILAKPFTVHTAFASALGRSSKGRVYVFITTADGNDLVALSIGDLIKILSISPLVQFHKL